VAYGEGERGVDHVLELLTNDVRRTMALVGARSIDELDRSLVERR
jgi:isopentenyl diphosphate isomerase/L-lactate dehydrogenase-like FMN-dependent dehydrogenase